MNPGYTFTCNSVSPWRVDNRVPTTVVLIGGGVVGRKVRFACGMGTSRCECLTGIEHGKKGRSFSHGKQSCPQFCARNTDDDVVVEGAPPFLYSPPENATLWGRASPCIHVYTKWYHLSAQCSKKISIHAFVFYKSFYYISINYMTGPIRTSVIFSYSSSSRIFYT